MNFILNSLEKSPKQIKTLRMLGTPNLKSKDYHNPDLRFQLFMKSRT